MMDLQTFVPVSAESEQACLCALMTGASLDAVQPLKASDFFHDAHADIFAAIQHLHAKRRPVDLVTVFEYLKDSPNAEAADIAYLQQLVDVATPTRHAAEHARRVREMAQRRALIDAAEQASEIASSQGGDAAAKLDQITSLFVGLQREHIAKVPRSLADVVLLRTEHYEAVERGTVEPGWRTGLAPLDRLLNGGLRPGGMYIVAARPSVGKSSLAQWVGMEQARAGRKTLFLSQEMPEAELADRAVASAGRIEVDRLLTGGLERDDWARIVDVQDETALRDFFVDDQPALTLGDVRAKAKQVKGLKVLILDYLQLCAGTVGREANRNAEIEQISRGLKQLAKELGIAVIALSQLNREVERRASKRPILADLRDSGAIEQDADVVGLMWTVRGFDGGRLVGLDLAKNRQGRTGEVALHFDGARQAWGESTESLSVPTPASSGRRRGFGDDD